MSQRSDEIHIRVRQYRTPAFADFMDEVYGAMSGEERDQLPGSVGEYVNAIVAHAVGNLPVFGDVLARAVAGQYNQSPYGERFIQDPTQSAPASSFLLFLDEDGQLVRVRNPELTRTTDDASSELVMSRYQSYEVLTGPLAGQRFDRFSRPLPSTPIVRPGVVTAEASLAEAVREAVRDITPKQPDGGRVFLCHASEDKVAVRALYTRLAEAGFSPWLDDEDLLPGQDWDREIRRTVKEAQVVLVCLSKRSEKRGYVQKEIRFALDVADEQPEGTIFIIPVRLEECEVPDRLSRWQWVDLYDERGEAKLEAALESRMRQVTP